MPREWITPDPGGPEAELHLWPYRSLPRRGFVWFVGLTAALLALPLIALVGSAILWGLLPFIAGTVAAVWWALSRSYRDGEVLEELRLWPDRIELVRHDPGRPPRLWQANPYWVTVQLHPGGGPVPNYLTLRGGDREVEIGAFLAEEERLTLHHELQEMLSAHR